MSDDEGVESSAANVFPLTTTVEANVEETLPGQEPERNEPLTHDEEVVQFWQTRLETGEHVLGWKLHRHIAYPYLLKMEGESPVLQRQTHPALLGVTLCSHSAHFPLCLPS